MIGMDRRTGRSIGAWDQFVSRVTQVMTTPLGSREHRRRFGSRVPETLGKNMSDALLLTAQAHAIDAFYNPANGIGDFRVDSCVATRRTDGPGILLKFRGVWRNERVQFEVQT